MRAYISASPPFGNASRKSRQSRMSTIVDNAASAHLLAIWKQPPAVKATERNVFASGGARNCPWCGLSAGYRFQRAPR